jgi:hypothetical protein
LTVRDAHGRITLFFLLEFFMSATKLVAGTTAYLAAFALGMFVVNAWLINSTQATQAQIAQRQAEINGGIQLSQLNNELVRALGTAVVAQNDTKIKDLLASHGITVEAKKDETPAANGTARPAAATPARR